MATTARSLCESYTMGSDQFSRSILTLIHPGVLPREGSGQYSVISFHEIDTFSEFQVFHSDCVCIWRTKASSKIVILTGKDFIEAAMDAPVFL